MREHHDVCRAIEAAIDQTPAVSGAAYFGSSAAGRADRLSDVDLVVRCGPEGLQVLLERLNASVGIVLFRPFTNDRTPSGRYWFSDTNPFARLDVSYYDSADFDEVLAQGRGFAQPPFRSIVVHSEPGADGSAATELNAWSPLDHDFGGALRAYHESGKQVARGLSPKRPLAEVESALAAYRSRGVRPEAWALYAASRKVLRSSA